MMKSINESVQNTANILIVDDIPANLKLLDHILKAKGYRIRPVPSGLLALQVAEKEKPDLILLDVMMPDMDGFEVCRILKANEDLKDVPIIFISALNDTNDIVKALSSGGADYITKPFQAEEVRARVATHVNLYRQKKELEQLIAVKDKFFSIIAHDLKGPFSSFLGVTQLLEEVLPSLSQEEIQGFASSMRNSATSLYRLLENLLQWARIQQGLMPYDPNMLLLLPVVEESVSMMKELAEKKEIEITLEISNDVQVYGDRNMLLTIIRNLVSNAIKFSHRGGKITISSKLSDNTNADISIQDYGIGMNSTILDNIFRLDVKTNREGTDGETSTGLGLILCKEFVEKHGGKIWAESEEGNGTVFHFTIPTVVI